MSNLLSRDRSGANGGVLARPLGDLWGDPFRNLFSMSQLSGMEVTRTETGYDIEIPVAGFRPDQIEATLEDGVLTVQGKNEKRSFTRSLVVPDDVDDEKIDAKVEDGMLMLKLTLHPKAQPKRITIKT
ncbi:MAG TPA: Hsp20/alpha crystallin family protein [Candidatus Rubrimentiphilum sp.]|nr:Hsp20/alpha crystallin family protein [Candidatus Rubrimentiphilum sp.]